jgi:leucyl aminopeptidase
VLNTDAEGRLVLADGLILADEQGADLVLDIATLTGAARVALGDKIGAVFGSVRDDVDQLVAAGAFAGERFWPMPLPADYRSNVDSEVADMTNTGGRYGGAINAALILKEFVGDRRWLHLDVAGPARAYENYGWTVKGGTGFGTRTLVRLAEMLGGID